MTSLSTYFSFIRQAITYVFNFSSVYWITCIPFVLFAIRKTIKLIRKIY